MEVIAVSDQASGQVLLEEEGGGLRSGVEPQVVTERVEAAVAAFATEAKG